MIPRFHFGARENNHPFFFKNLTQFFASLNRFILLLVNIFSLFTLVYDDQTRRTYVLLNWRIHACIRFWISHWAAWTACVPRLVPFTNGQLRIYGVQILRTHVFLFTAKLFSGIFSLVFQKKTLHVTKLFLLFAESTHQLGILFLGTLLFLHLLLEKFSVHVQFYGVHPVERVPLFLLEIVRICAEISYGCIGSSRNVTAHHGIHCHSSNHIILLWIIFIILVRRFGIWIVKCLVACLAWRSSRVRFVLRLVTCSSSLDFVRNDRLFSFDERVYKIVIILVWGHLRQLTAPLIMCLH